MVLSSKGSAIGSRHDSRQEEQLSKDFNAYNQFIKQAKPDNKLENVLNHMGMVLNSRNYKEESKTPVEIEEVLNDSISDEGNGGF